jgi:hypothetical protein
MAFASGQTVTAAMLNRITRNSLEALVTANDTVTTSEVDLSGATLSITTTQANTILTIFASLDTESTGNTDIGIVKLVVNGTGQADELNFRGANRGRQTKVWLVTVAAASTFTVKLTRRKVNNADAVTIYSTHSTLTVEGNGIS